MSTNPPTPPTLIPTPGWYDDVVKLIREGIDKANKAINEIGNAYVQAIDRSPAFREYLEDELPHIPCNFWRMLERVGRGQLDGRIAAGGVSYSNRLQRLPLSEQHRALDGTIPMLTSSGDVLDVKIDNVLPDQADQLFAKDHIRSLPEQRIYLEQVAAEKATAVKALKVKSAKDPIVVDRKRKGIYVTGDSLFISGKDMLRYMQRIEER